MRFLSNGIFFTIIHCFPGVLFPNNVLGGASVVGWGAVSDGIEGRRKARPQVELERGWHMNIAGVSHRVAGVGSSLKVVAVKYCNTEFHKNRYKNQN